ncbi:MAG TPA: hypothetical protein VFU81_04980 [Thermomicrobiales bacterium]|nr:hypothetical protein [Thermomicrobiales bacterium]
MRRGDGDERVGLGRMQPAAAEIDTMAAVLDAIAATAEAVSGFDQQARHAGVLEPARRGDAGGAGADNNNFGFRPHEATLAGRNGRRRGQGI